MTFCFYFSAEGTWNPPFRVIQKKILNYKFDCVSFNKRVGISMAIQFKHARICCGFLKSLPCISSGPLGYIFYLFSDVKYILFNSFPQIFRGLSSSLLNSKLIWKRLCHYIESLDRMSGFFPQRKVSEISSPKAHVSEEVNVQCYNGC